MKNIILFLRKETVLCVALVLAAVSAFIVPPDVKYAEYIDFRTLAILFCLMSVMAGLQKMGFFGNIAKRLLSKVKSGYSLILILVLMCFFFSMVITNDVALITFVPFTFIILNLLGQKKRNRLILQVTAMQTIAANLGSMLTPIGNPQNLYLYGKAGISIGRFILLMLPYAFLALVLLIGWSMLLGRRFSMDFNSGKINMNNRSGLGGAGGKDAAEENSDSEIQRYRIYVYIGLFIFCLFAVGHIISWQAVLALVLVTVFVMDRDVLARVDYSLLFTFAGFFIFIGNMGRIPAFRDFLEGIIVNREVLTSIAASQLISNVPAALLLSGFTADYGNLIIGVNLGGLGTLIASMASLISYKYIAKEEPARKGAYIGMFTAGNIVFLAALAVLYKIMTGL